MKYIPAFLLILTTIFPIYTIILGIVIVEIIILKFVWDDIKRRRDMGEYKPNKFHTVNPPEVFIVDNRKAWRARLGMLR